MQSIEIPVVTQIRVSGDYSPDNKQWKIGDSTIIAHAVGLAAFKDVSTVIIKTNNKHSSIGRYAKRY